MICDIFKHSQVFRIGGDEFAVISQNEDYMHVEELVENIKRRSSEAKETGGIVIASGISKYEKDSCVAEVFERADMDMYEHKNELKNY